MQTACIHCGTEHVLKDSEFGGHTKVQFKCSKCGHVGEGEPHVSVRAMILSVIRFGIADAEPAYMIEKGWAAYRKQKELDLYGKGLAPKSTHLARCFHPQVR